VSQDQRLKAARELLEGHATEAGKASNSPEYEAKCEMAVRLLKMYDPTPGQSRLHVYAVRAYMADGERATLQLYLHQADANDHVHKVMYGDDGARNRSLLGINKVVVEPLLVW
jgi:hypothetical protein